MMGLWGLTRLNNRMLLFIQALSSRIARLFGGLFKQDFCWKGLDYISVISQSWILGCVLGCLVDHGQYDYETGLGISKGQES